METAPLWILLLLAGVYFGLVLVAGAVALGVYLIVREKRRKGK